jgi:large subunit ribosomal protein L6
MLSLNAMKIRGSRIGLMPIPMLEGVNINVSNNVLSISGPKGSTDIKWNNSFKITDNNNQIIVQPVKKSFSNAMWGTLRSRINSLIKGVSIGYTKIITLDHVGYKASEEVVNNKKCIKFSLGKSHVDYLDINFVPGVTLSIGDKQNLLKLESVDSAVLGNAIAKLKRLRLPTYKGPRIIAEGDIVIKRIGKQTK